MAYEKWQTISRILFLMLFIGLVITGYVQLWMGIFVISLFLSLFFGRFYCGWLCPIGAVINGVTRLRKRLYVREPGIPAFFTWPLARYLVLSLFLITVFLVLTTYKKIPVLPFLLICGVVITLLYSENLWHRYLCPFGTLLSIMGSKSQKSIKIVQEQCVQCGICKSVCPGEAITKTGVYSINKSSCLLCLQCVKNCSQNAIKYS